MNTPETLREIAQDYVTVNNLILESGGEVTPDIEEAIASLDRLQDSLDSKVDAISRIIEDSVSFRDHYSRMAGKYQARSKAFAVSVERWKTYILEQMEAANVERAGRELPKRIQPNPSPSYEWVDIGNPIPDGFRKHTISLDKRAAHIAWLAGKLPEGIKATKGSHLRDVNVVRKPKGDASEIEPD